MDYRKLCLSVHYEMVQAHEHAILGHWSREPADAEYHYNQIVANLNKAAAALGFDLVKREKKDEAA